MTALEDIGYRIVGTKEHIVGREYVYDHLETLKAKCELVEGLECELELQQGSGHHRYAFQRILSLD